MSTIFMDVKSNPRNPRIQLLLIAFRIASQSRLPRDRAPRVIAYPVGILYRVFSEWVLGIELPWRTIVRGPVTIYHGYGLVVNDGVSIGSRVILRNGVTLGHLVEGGACPVLEDGVEVGVGASILGNVRVGSGARIGAGAVVLSDVPAGATAVGVPARIILS